MSIVGILMNNNYFVFVALVTTIIVNRTLLIEIIGVLCVLITLKGCNGKSVSFLVSISGVLICQILTATLLLAILHS